MNWTCLSLPLRFPKRGYRLAVVISGSAIIVVGGSIRVLRLLGDITRNTRLGSLHLLGRHDFAKFRASAVGLLQTSALGLCLAACT